MRYEDASLSGSFENQGPTARDDADQLAAGDRGPATGNVISGAGTQSGAAGADLADGAKITAVAGAGGTDTSFDGGRLRVEGEHGSLSLSARGDYQYTARAGTPENSRDTFTYTLTDAAGARSEARLVIEIGKTQAVVNANAQRVVPGPDGVVVLPAGVELSDVRIVGRDLLIMLPDGTQMLIVDGAVFVPQLVINDVEVPSTNLAALLIDQEPRPAAGVPQSSGGNFIEAVGPLDPGTPLGDLLPPTVLTYTPPEFREVAFEEDRQPTIGANPIVQLDDDARAGGNPGGVGDDVDSANVTGTLSGAGGDGPLTFAFTAAGAPTGFSYSVGSNGALIVRQGETVVLTVTVNPQTGAYTVVQNAPISHAAGGDENNVVFTFNYTVTDRDGDQVAGTLQVNVDDDTPTIALSAGADAGVTLTTDDADSRGEASDSASSTANFGGVFTLAQSVGADGLGTATGAVYSLGTPGGASGLTQGGAAINLYLVGGKVVGSTAASAAGITAGNTVFDVAVNASGSVTLTQYSQIDHTNTDPTPGGSPFNDQVISLADNLVTLTANATITDRDGDSASSSASIQIGANLRFTDDGPSLTGAQGGAGATLDETSAGTAAGFPITATSASAVIVGTGLTFGADGPAASGATTYAIAVNGTGATTLRTAQGEFPITLVQTSATVITGTYDGGKTAFTVTINANGSLTVVQSVPLEHNVDGSTAAAFDDSLDLSGLINATVSLRDFDGDTASASAAIGNLVVFKDDGPDSRLAVEAPRPSLVLDETQPAGSDSAGAGAPSGIASVTLGFGSQFAAASYGADGAGSTAYALVLSGTNVASGMYALQMGDVSANDGDPIGRGEPIVLNQNGNVITGSVGGTAYFTIAIDPATGAVTFTQLLPVFNPVGGSSFDEAAVLNAVAGSLVVRQTVTDSDGDSDSSDVDVSQGVFQIQDDGPLARADADAIAAGTYGPESGNVITGVGTTSGASGVDTLGRDGATVVAVGAGEASDSSFDEAGNLVIVGQYGILSIKADGSYSYVRNEGTKGGVSDVFTYTLRDTDGDLSSSTLTIAIGNNAPTIDAPNLGAPGTSVDEKGLPVRGTEPEGSGEEAAAGPNGDASETTTGTITLSQGDGPAVVTIAGVTVTGATQVIDTGEGLLTITEVTPTSISYSYTLKDNLLVSGSGTTDVIPVTITDQDGSTASDTLTITILDDVPTARNDSDSIAAGTFGPETGNVISGSGTTSGAAGKDTLGADGAAVAGVQAGVSATAIATGVGTSIAGQYGTLTLNADGSYSYVRNTGTPGGVTDSFSYTLKDGDGDTSVARLDIVIQDAPVTVTPPPVGDASTVVYESGLPARAGEPAGSNEPANSETVSGSIAFVSKDGLQAISLGGVALNLGGTFPQTITTANGQTLVVTGVSYNAATGAGSISYTYTLTDNTLGVQATNGGDTTASFAIVVTDKDGDTGPASNLVITIKDDAPTARADTDSVGNNVGPETGNVISGTGTTSGAAGADTPGADGAVIAGVQAGSSTTAIATGVGTAIAGTYGTLTLNADGSYSYVRANGAPLNASDVFSYTLKDGDGDTSVATLTIATNDQGVTSVIPAADGVQTTVYEAALPSRGVEPEGSGEESAPGANGDTREAVSGAITFTAPDGIGSFSLNGVTLSVSDVNKVVSDTPTATLTVTSITFNAGTGTYSVNYTYLLKDNTVGAVPPATGNTSTAFAFVITDSDGDASGGNLVITVVDDAPTARFDTDSVIEGASTSGNVIAGTGTDSGLAGKDTLGADGAVVVGVKTGGDTTVAASGSVGVQINGAYGKLTLNADGTYTYVANPNSVTAGQNDVFTYSIRDADGDVSTTTLTITVNNVTLIPDTEVASVKEAALDLVKDPADLSAGTATGSNSGSTEETVSGQLSVAGATVYTLNSPAAGANGILQLNADGSYKYTLTTPFTTNPAANDGAVVSGSNVFSYTATDINGNSVTGTITINIVDDVPTARIDTDTVAAGTFGPISGNVITGAGTNEGTGGSGADTKGADGASVVGIKAGVDNVATATGVGSVINGQYGTLTIAADGSYSYTRNPNTAGGVTDSFSYTLKDGDGDTSVTQLTIVISDSPVSVTPPPAGATTTVYEAALGDRGPSESQGSVEGSTPGANDDTREAVSGSIAFVSKDGLGAISLDGVSINLSGSYPQTIVNTAGQTLVVTGVSYDPATGAGSIAYTYTLNDNTIGVQATNGGDTTATFPVVVTDKDGDSNGGNLVITIKDDAPTANDDAFEILEGDADNAITFDVDLNDVPGADGTGSRPFTSLTGTYGTLTLNADGTQTYTLSAAGQAAINALAPNATLTDNFSYTLNDGDGDSDPANVVVTLRGTDDPVTITDLTPALNGGDATVDEDDLAGGSDLTKESTTVTGDFKIAAPDGVDDLTVGGVAVIVNGAFQAGATGTTPLGNTIVFTGYNPATGVVSYSYTLLAAEAHAAVAGENSLFDNLAVSLTDVDGDLATDTLSINIIDDVPTANDDSDRVTEGNGNVADGNVLSGSGGSDANSADGVADVRGADGASVVGARTGTEAAGGAFGTVPAGATGTVISGTYGDLLIKADGSYVYTLKTASIPTNVTSETFSYQLRDGDGDLDVAQLTINFDQDLRVPAAGNAITTVFEDGLADGVQHGANSEFASGSFSVDFKGESGSAAIGATTLVAGATVVTAKGVLTIDSVTTSGTTTTYNYTYELKAAQTHTGQGEVNDVLDSFTVTATDATGDSGTGTITIRIVDDFPVAALDSGTVTEGATLTVSAAAGVLANDVFGADGKDVGGGVVGVAAGNTGVASTSGVGTSITTALGTLTLNANGSYTYVANANVISANTTDTFTYTIRDGDGDLSFTTLTINLNAVNLTAQNQVGNVYEAALDLVKDAGDLAAGTVTGSTPGATTESFSGTLSNAFAAVNGYTPQTVSDANGIFKLNADGTYTYTLTSPLSVAGAGNNLEATKTFTYTVVDANGNNASGTVSINIYDDVPSVAVTGAAEPSITVDETNLSVDNSASFAGAFAATYGADGPAAVNPLAYTLNVSASGAASGLTDSITGNGIFLFKVGSTVVGKVGTDAAAAQAGSTVAFVVSVAANGTVTLDQQRAVIHSPDSGPDQSVSLASDNLITLSATATDGDGDSASSTAIGIGSNLIFKDDVGSLGAFTGTVVPNSTGASGSGTFAYNQGADTHGSFLITGTPPTGISYTTTQNANGALLTATADPDGAGPQPAVTIYTLQVNTNGTYQFTLVTPESAKTTTVSLLGLSAGGPTPFLQTADGLVEFTGSGAGVNSSTQGFGVDNQFVSFEEAFTVEFHSTGQAGDQAATVNPRYVSTATLFNDNVNGTGTTYSVKFINTATGQTETKTYTVTLSNSSLLLDPDTMAEFNRIEVTGIGGSGQGVRFTRLDYTETVLPADLNLSFNVTAIDKDGDATAVQTIAVSIDSTPPVVLDLDGDGFAFRSVDNGVAYDFNGDGRAEHSAWAGPNDGILVRDANGNGLVDNASEFVFGQRGQSDLQALAARYGEALDGGDADYALFGVWTDANSNGVVDAGEYRTLTEAGITGIGLVSDGISYNAANGDVHVSGTSTFTRADGTTGKAADAAFRIVRSDVDPALTAANSNIGLVAAAAAAAALGAVPTAAQPVAAGEPSVHVQGQVDLAAVAAANVVDAHAAPVITAAIGGGFGQSDAFGYAAANEPIQHLANMDEVRVELVRPVDEVAPMSLLDQGIGLAAHADPVGFGGGELHLPAADQLAALFAVEPVQSNATLGQVLVEALSGGEAGPSIDQLIEAAVQLAEPIQHAPGGQVGRPEGGLAELATQLAHDVPAWDGGHGGGMIPAFVAAMDAPALHPDAVQPVANG